MAFGASAPDMTAWLGRKYAILQQQANAADTQNKNQKIGIVADANLANVKSALLPKETMAGIAKTNAETGMITEQTNWLAPEAQARISNLGANTALTGTQNRIAVRESLTPASALFGASLGSMPSMYQLSASTAPANSSSIAQRLKATPRSKWTAQDLDDYQSLFD